MVRKQLYIDPTQDAALKRKAKELGVSEAELVRRALKVALSEAIPASTQKNTALESFLEDSLRLSKVYRPDDAYRFKRADAYSSEQRFDRWGEDVL